METTRMIQAIMEFWGAMLCVIAYVCISVEKTGKMEVRQSFIRIFSLCMLLLVSDALANAFRGNMTELGWYVVRVSNFAVFLLQYMLTCSVGHYILVRSERGDDKKLMNCLRLMNYVTAFLFFILLANIPMEFLYAFDEQNRYYRGQWFSIEMLLSCVMSLCIVYALWRVKDCMARSEFVLLAAIVIMPVFSMLIQFVFYGISVINLLLTLDAVAMFIAHEIRNAEQVIEQERRLQQVEIDLLRSQIQPHFLFNSLAVIRSLIRTDPIEAEHALNDFSQYLRGVINSMDESGMCTLDEDLEIAEYYLALEQRRFSEELIIDMDVEEYMFMVPYMTVQPLVENAIKHGLRQRTGDGTVTVRSRKADGCYVLEVEDDGVGFDTSKLSKDRSNHIGVWNVENRIRLLCKGTMTIESTVGVGTKVTITIPDSYPGGENY